MGFLVVWGVGGVLLGMLLWEEGVRIGVVSFFGSFLGLVVFYL